MNFQTDSKIAGKTVKFPQQYIHSRSAPFMPAANECRHISRHYVSWKSSILIIRQRRAITIILSQQTSRSMIWYTMSTLPSSHRNAIHHFLNVLIFQKRITSSGSSSYLHTTCNTAVSQGQKLRHVADIAKTYASSKSHFKSITLSLSWQLITPIKKFQLKRATILRNQCNNTFI